VMSLCHNDNLSHVIIWIRLAMANPAHTQWHNRAPLKRNELINAFKKRIHVIHQGMLLAKDIRDRERGGRAEIKMVEGDAEERSPAVMELMKAILGERTCELQAGTPDEKADQEQKSKLVLYQ